MICDIIKFLSIVASLFLCTVSRAQGERANRVLEIGAFAEHKLLWDGEGGVLHARPAKFNAGEHTVIPAMSLAGDAQFLDGTGGTGLPSMILCGRNPATNKGVLQLVVWDEPGSSYMTPPGGVLEVPGTDLVGVAWSDQNQILFVLDAVSQLIAMAPYIAGDALPVASWTVLITSATEPALASASDLIMSLDHDGSDIVLTLSHHPDLTGKDRTAIHVTAQGPQISTIPGPEGRTFEIENLDLIDGAISLRVKGTPDTPVEVLHILDAGPQVLGSGTLDSSGNALVSLSAPLVMGEAYGTRVMGFPWTFPPFETPVFREGVAEALDGGSTIRPAPSGLAFTAYLGAPRFKLPFWLDPVDVSQVQAPATYNLGVHVNTVPDIVPLQDGRKVLVPSAAGPSILNVWAKDEPGFGFVPLPIPDDPSVAGVTIYFQWAIIVDPVAPIVKISDIVGFRIRDARWVPPGSEALFGVGGTSAAKQSAASQAGPVSDEDRRAAAMAWLEACGLEIVSRDYVTEFLRKVRRSRR